MLTEEEQAFVLEWHDYAQGVAMNHRDIYYYVDEGDLRSWANFGLLKAARLYDPGHFKAVPPNVYVAGCVRHTIIDFLRHEYQLRRKITEAPLELIQQSPHLSVLDRYTERLDDVSEAAQVIQTVEKQLVRGSRPWQIFQLLYSGFTQKEIGKMLNVHESRVSQIKTRVLRPLFQNAMN